MQAIYSALYAIVSTGLWKSTDGYLRINLCSRAFNEANVTNSGRYLISPVFGQKQGCRVEFLMGLQDRNVHEFRSLLNYGPFRLLGLARSADWGLSLT